MDLFVSGLISQCLVHWVTFFLTVINLVLIIVLVLSNSFSVKQFSIIPWKSLAMILLKIKLSSFHYHLLHSVWSSVQSNLLKNIYNFTICYILNNSLATHKNLFKWGSLKSPDCSFCLSPESFLHVVAGCQHYLECFTWRHDSILNFIATSLQTAVNDCFSLCWCEWLISESFNYNWWHFPSRSSFSNIFQVFIYVLCSRTNRKNLINDWTDFKCVRFVNISMNSLGVFSDKCSTFLDMMNDIGIVKKRQLYIIRKVMNLAIRRTYFIFCCSSK